MRVVQDYISQYAPRWAGPGSEGVRGLSGSCPGCSPLELRVQRTRSRCRDDRPLPPAPGAQPFPNPTQPCPVPAADPDVTMNPAVFLSLPDLRCSLLLLVSEGMTDPSTDARAASRPSSGGTPLPPPLPSYLFLWWRRVHLPPLSSLSACVFTLPRPGVPEA